MNELLENIDLSNVSLVEETYPVIDNQTLRCVTGQVEIKRTKGGSGPRRLVIPLTLQEPAKSTDGRELTADFQTTVGFLIDESGGWTQKRANEELAKFQVAVLKLDKPTNFNTADLSPYQGKELRVQFAAQRNDPTRQDVKAWLKA